MHFPIPDLHLFNIGLAVVGTLGIGGAIAALIFAPLVAEPILGAVLKVIGRVLATRIGLATAVGIGSLIVGELYGTHEANLKCRATILAKEKAADDAATQRDDTQATIRSTEDQDYITKLEANNKTSEDQINAYIQQLATRKDSVCRLTPDDERTFGGVRH